jgi:tRNA dimethylallyltransferase
VSPEPLMVLAGPTAVGKTALAIEVCQRFEAEVINADSVQIYRGLDIGSAKPTPAERAAARHHLVDVADPAEPFDAARFADLAEQAISDIRSRHKRVLVAGGTGLYIRALLYGLAPLPPVDEKLRTRLRDEWERSGATAMHERLAGLDPESADRLHPNDRQRVLRALEVSLQTGQPFSAHQKQHGFAAPRHPHFLVGLTRSKPELGQRIARRCHAMWREGLADEVRGLLAQGVPPEAKALGSLGYAQALRHVQGQLSQAEAIAETIARTRAYAKRQLTWFRGMEGINWHSPQDHKVIFDIAARHWGGLKPQPSPPKEQRE